MQEPDKKKPEKQESPAYSARCVQRCSPSVGCAVLAAHPYRDYSDYVNPHLNLNPVKKPEVKKEVPKTDIQNEGAASKVKPKVEPKENVYFPVPSSSDKLAMTWTPLDPDTIKPNKFGPTDALYTIAALPQLDNIIPGIMDTGYLVRYCNPGDFHLLLEKEIDYKLDAQKWKKYFSSKDKHGAKINIHFKSGLDLFRGFVFMLSHYMNYVGKYELIDENIAYKVNDLVACVVPRDVPTSPRKRVFAYRGVVIEDIRVPLPPYEPEVKHQAVRKDIAAVVVYLLDTGETRVVEKTAKGFLAPLPGVFTAFPPLALPCALYGVSPVGGEWSDVARKEMKKLVYQDENKGGVKLNVKFHPKDSIQQEAVPITGIQPYLVELTAIVEDTDASKGFRVDVSAALVKKNYAVDSIAKEPAVEKEAFRVREEPARLEETKETRGRGRGRGRTVNK